MHHGRMRFLPPGYGLALALLLSVHSAMSIAESYTDAWRQFNTQLIVKEPTFQAESALVAEIDTFRPIEYMSDDMRLAAYLDTRNIDPDKPKPAVVYLHGGFGLRAPELQAAAIFSSAGFIVLTPTWRGENANPGYFECFLGEVGDAKAAIKWLAGQDFVDENEIYVFGWSVGGGIALNLALHDDIPVRLGGSSAGIYDLDLIKSWATEDELIKFPYDYQDDDENYFRLPIYHLQDMVRPHITYVGSQDGYAEAATLYRGLYPEGDTKLQLIEVAGDHMASLPLAINEFLKVIARSP